MKDTGKRESIEEEETLPLRLVDVVREDLRAFVVRSGMQALAELLEEERAALCGPRYQHDPQRTSSRAGYAPGELVMGGRRVSVPRPRVRDREGREVPLASWSAFGEGLDETLTVKRLDLPAGLERILSTTNAIENLMGSVRGQTQRVKKWKDGRMMLRWVATALDDASTRFRRVVSATAMRDVAVALRGVTARIAQETNAA